MARSIRSTTSRKSRNWGIRSGSTYVTLPASGVTIDANGVQNKQGYMAGFTTNGLMMVSGVTTITGSGVTRTFAGLTTISAVLTTPAIKYSGATRATVVIVPGSALGAGWLSGTTNVGFSVYEHDNTLSASAVSINYLAIGA